MLVRFKYSQICEEIRKNKSKLETYIKYYVSEHAANNEYYEKERLVSYIKNPGLCSLYHGNTIHSIKNYLQYIDNVYNQDTPNEYKDITVKVFIDNMAGIVVEIHMDGKMTKLPVYVMKEYEKDIPLKELIFKGKRFDDDDLLGIVYKLISGM